MSIGSIGGYIGGGGDMTVGGCGGAVTQAQVGHAARVTMLAVESAVAITSAVAVSSV